MSSVKRAFRIRPDHLVPDFLKHVADKGEPHTWVHHSHEAPARNGITVLKLNFSIPKHFVALNGRAPCPICSPTTPKYEMGHLLWSEESGKLHAVGHCCGHNFFAEGVYAEGLAAARRRESRNADEATIEANWRLPAELVELANRSRLQVRAFDSVVKFIKNSLSKDLTRIIYRNAAESGGLLSVLEYVKVDEEAEGSLKAIAKPFGIVPLFGYEVLRGGARAVSAEGRLHQATIAFEQLAWRSEDDAISWLIMQPDKDLQQLVKWLRDASSTINGIRADLTNLNAFLEPANLNLLNDWLKEIGRSEIRLARDRTHLSIRRSNVRRAVIPAALAEPLFDPVSEI